MEDKSEIQDRRKLAARQIKAAVEAKGWTRKQFAEQMGRSPSEITKWLSGTHNFTIALLEEISKVLDKPISALSPRMLFRSIEADDWGAQECLHDSAVCYLPQLPLSSWAYDRICVMAHRDGKSIENVAAGIIEDSFKTDRADVDAFRYCGIIPDSFPSVEEIRKARVGRKRERKL